MKYTDTQIGFQEFPDEISLLINISNCPFHCPGCHSPELWEDVGIKLTFKELHRLIATNSGITCVGFMGGSLKEVIPFAEYVKNIDPPLKVGWYTGGNIKENELLDLKYYNFDYIKTGPYIKELGGLDKPSTNQRMYQYSPYFSDYTIGRCWRDITYKFWKHGKGNKEC